VFRYPLAVSLRTPVASSMRRKDHPSFPRAITCCFFSSLKTLLMPREPIRASLGVNVPGFLMAGFQVTLYGRFWLTAEAESCPRAKPSLDPNPRRIGLSCKLREALVAVIGGAKMGNSFFWQTLIKDLKYAARSLSKNPGFVCIVVASLALGIGVNSTIFSVMNALLYRPLPYRGADRMVAIWETPLGHPDQWQPPPIAEVLDWLKQGDIFEGIALTSGTESSILSGTGGPEPIRVQDVTANFFDLVSVKPMLGRIFVADEQQELTQAVVISYSFWKKHFDGDPGVLGQTFTNHNTGIVSTVVGIMPPGFAPFYG